MATMTRFMIKILKSILPVYCLFFPLTLNIYSDSYTERINIFLEAKKFDYMQINNSSEDIVSGSLVLGNQDIILKIESPYRESYIINDNFVTCLLYTSDAADE